MNTGPRPFILASQSPRRKELLKRLLPTFEVLVSHVDELEDPHIPGPVMASANAKAKAEAVARLRPEAWVLGSDTVVCLENIVLNKPRDRDHAREMIRMLSGRTHQVISGLALRCEETGFAYLESVTSEVAFFQLSPSAIETYLDRIPATEYAGGYPIQDCLGWIVSGFAGSYSNIVGLPLEALEALLKRTGILD